jgi:hypothetical protein
LLAVLALCLAVLFAYRTEAKFCPSPDLGYSFTVPDDWDEVDHSIVLRLQQQIDAKTPGDLIKCVEAYQPKSHGQALQFPYVLVELVKYPKGQLVHSITEKELKDTASQLSGANAEKLVRAEGGPQLDGGISITYQTSPPGVDWSTIMKDPAGDVRAQVISRLGREHVVQLCMYDGASDWNRFAPDAQSISTSFSLDAAHSATLNDDSIWNNLLPMVIIGAIVGLVGYLRATRKKRDKIASLGQGLPS